VTRLHREQARARNGTINNTVNAAFLKRLNKLRAELEEESGRWGEEVRIIALRF